MKPITRLRGKFDNHVYPSTNWPMGVRGKISQLTTRVSRIIFLSILATLSACGGSNDGVRDTVGNPPPLVIPNGPLEAQLAQARAEIDADICFRQVDTSACAWTNYVYSPNEFAMTSSTGEAILIVDSFPQIPGRAIRFSNRLKGYFRLGANGIIAPATSSLRIPTVLLSVLKRFSTPTHISTQDLRSLAAPMATSYGRVNLENAGHGSYVFSLLADANPNQPIVLMDEIKLATLNPTDYCDISGAPETQGRLLAASRNAATGIIQMMRAQNVRFVNLSSGQTLQTVVESWQRTCASPIPNDQVLRAKLAAYAPIYEALFGTPGVMTAHAAFSNSSPTDFPYDYPTPMYANRMRAGYFTTLESGLDGSGRGNHATLTGFPSAANVDVYFNTGVLPERPFAYNRTPLLQVDSYGIDVFPITGPQTSWITPLALTRLINIRYAAFGAREMNNELIAELFDTARPLLCPDLPDRRCLFQDPLLHGQTEAVRLNFRSPYYP